jgi:ABC-type bacteriocin/lantibiotic exporter with double-glycine peptidase domain
MLNLKPFRQSPGFCGPASLKMVFDHFGTDFSEAEIGKACNTTKEQGTNHVDMINGAKRLGFDPKAKDNATLADIRDWLNTGVPVVVGWWSTDEDHYSVVYGIDEKNIYLMDPELDEGKREMPLEEWDKVWFDFEGPLKYKVERWMLAAPPKAKVG